jgi:hypothetical protein
LQGRRKSSKYLDENLLILPPAGSTTSAFAHNPNKASFGSHQTSLHPQCACRPPHLSGLPFDLHLHLLAASRIRSISAFAPPSLSSLFPASASANHALVFMPSSTLTIYTFPTCLSDPEAPATRRPSPAASFSQPLRLLSRAGIANPIQQLPKMAIFPLRGRMSIRD